MKLITKDGRIHVLLILGRNPIYDDLSPVLAPIDDDLLLVLAAIDDDTNNPIVNDYLSIAFRRNPIDDIDFRHGPIDDDLRPVLYWHETTSFAPQFL